MSGSLALAKTLETEAIQGHDPHVAKASYHVRVSQFSLLFEPLDVHSEMPIRGWLRTESP
jgi:hypothetical protein